MKKVVIIGAGPGGLSAGMLLTNAGYNVEVYEIKDYIGGRTSAIKIKDYLFDMGPTFLMMPDVLKDLFKKVGRELSDYVELKEIESLYRLVFKDKEFYPSRNKEFMKEQIKKYFPNNYQGYLRFLQKE